MTLSDFRVTLLGTGVPINVLPPELAAAELARYGVPSLV